MHDFSRDSTLTPEQWKQIEAEIIITGRQEMYGREIFGAGLNFNNFGVQQYSYDKLTEMSAATIAYNLVEEKDLPDLTRNNLPLPVLQKDYFINERDLLSSQTTGTPLNTSSAQAAAYQVSLLENQMLVVGNAEYSVNGLYNSAGNDYSTPTSFGTFGNPTLAYAGAINLLLADKIYPPYNSCLAYSQWVELLASLSTTGERELPIITDLLNGGRTGGGRIWVDLHMTAGTGMVFAANGAQRGLYKYVLAQDLTTDIVRKAKADQGGLKGKVFVAGAPVIYDSNSISKMSVI